MVKLLWTPEGWEDYVSCQMNDPELISKINTLIKDISRNPFTGLGKPEPLKDNYRGWWSRRISSEHRLAQRIVGKDAEKHIEIAHCRYHYSGT